MPTIEFYGAGGLEMTPQLTSALGRYAKHYCGLDENWDFIGTNLDKPSPKDHDEPIILSIPVYFQKTEESPNPFFSFDKLTIFQDEKLQISENLKTLIDRAININEVLIDRIFTDSRPPKILNIQSGDLNYWKNQLEELFKFENTTFYIFYWHKNSNEKQSLNFDTLKEIKNKYEIKDKVWGYSKFMRDFLKIRNRCYEWEIGEIEKFESSQIKELIETKLSTIELNSSFENGLWEKVNNLLVRYNLYNQVYKIEYYDLAKLYIYNRNSFFDENFFEKKFEKAIIQGTGNAHSILREKDEILLNPAESHSLGMLENKLFFYDLFKNVAHAYVQYNYVKIHNNQIPDFIFLDDNSPDSLMDPMYESYRNKIAGFIDWFPESRFYYCDKPRFLNSFFGKEEYNVSMFEDSRDKEVNEIKIKTIESIALNFTTLRPLFIGIDIDWDGESLGYNLLKEFRRNIHKLNRPAFIFVFSRFEYPSTIRKSVASGALFYITKQNYMKLVPHVYTILRSLEIKKSTASPEKNQEASIEITQEKYSQYENWHLLNKLEPEKIIDLKSKVIDGFCLDEMTDEIYKKKHAYRWIEKLPKADLHCHIGSCLGPDLLPLTALLVLAEKFSFNEKSDDKKLEIRSKIEKSIQFVSIFVNGLEFNDQQRLILKVPDLSKAFGIANTQECLFEELTTTLMLTEKLKFPEEALLNPFFSDMDLALFGNVSNHPYFKLRHELKKLKVSYDDIMLFFILMIFVKENLISNKEEFENKIVEKFKELFDFKESKTIDDYITAFVINIDKKVITPSIVDFVDCIANNINGIKNAKKDEPGILESLQAVTGRSNSLFTYLRGCEYGGSPHLQTKTSIFIACYFIVHKYAIPDNIRYLTLRCAVDGYTKSGLIKTQDEAMESLLQGLDFAVQKANENKEKQYHVDVILTAKRHKSLEEFKQNADLAIKYRNGLISDQNTEEEKLFSFFDTKTKVVSFDLAGLEKGNRAGKFYDYFLPLLKQCFPITIHAGEEDSHEAIWEAIYEVQSQRIGHALTLRNSRELMNSVKDRHIAIELCPLSNILTRKGKPWEQLAPQYRNIRDEYIQDKYYPLRQYLMENMDVTINTDNPFVSDCTLTKEFLVAAWYAGGLTKWEILRLIKNSFRSAVLPREQKRLLMNEIDDEIYNILLEEDM